LAQTGKGPSVPSTSLHVRSEASDWQLEPLQEDVVFASMNGIKSEHESQHCYREDVADAHGGGNTSDFD